MAQFKSLSQQELIVSLNCEKQPFKEASGVLVLEDIIWGQIKGSYRALGKLKLPIQVMAYSDYESLDHYDEISSIQYQIATMFNYNFFQGHRPKNIYDDLEVYGDLGWNTLYEKRWKVIGASASSNKCSANKFVAKHVEKFFDLYVMKHEFNGELGECLSQAFEKYI